MKQKKPATFWGRLKKHTLPGSVALGAVVAVSYWGVYASDLYISEAHVLIQNTQISSGQTFDLGSLLGATSPTNDRADQLLLRDHLLSIDMLRKLDASLHLKEHYMNPEHDWFSRMGTRYNRFLEIEEFHDYYLGRVSVEFDDYAGVLVIQAEAYDPQTARAITAALVKDGEQFMNTLAHNLAQEQLDFLKRQVAEIGQSTLQARQDLLDYQNRHGLASPQATTENLAGIVNGLQAQLAGLRASRTAMLGYLMPDSAGVVDLNLQIAAVEQQIAIENAKLAAPQGKALNSAVEEYQRLEMKASFTQDVYKTALTSLEQGRLEASRTIKKMSVLLSPTLPEYPLEPRRIYTGTLFVLGTLIVSGIAHLLAAIIRDHKD